MASSLWKLKQELSKIATAHHCCSILLLISFYVSRTVPPFCSWMYPDRECFLEQREYELMLFLIVVVALKNRRSASWTQYISTLFLFGKLANLVLFYRSEPRYAILYGVILILQSLFLPEPVPKVDGNITYFSGTALQDELEREPLTTWVIAFYTTWSPPCMHLQPIFAEISNEYSLPNLKFGKLDVGRYPKEAERFRVSDAPTSRQLPTVTVFKKGKFFDRRPLVDPSTKRAITFAFSKENIIGALEFNGLYKECLGYLPSKERNALKSEEKKD